MKNFLFFMLFGLLSLGLSAQEWAPIGAKWYYDERFATSGDIDYILYTSEKDTIFKGQNCRKISKRHDLICYDRPLFELMYVKNDSVFFYDPKLDAFQLLYKFNANKNDTWSLRIKEEQNGRIDTLNIFVDSIGNMVANNQSLKLLYVTYNIQYENYSKRYHSRIVEKFGDLSFMFNFYPSSADACDFNLSNGIRCYEDSTIGMYHFPLMDSCSYTWTGINTNTKGNLILYPNPFDVIIHISGLNEPASFTINDMYGKIVETGIIKDSQIVVNNLSKGIYILRIIDSKGIKIGNEKIVKK